MVNWIHKILKSIYVYLGFKLSYTWAELLFPNRTVYGAMLVHNCYTMKQFRYKNEFLLSVLLNMDNNQKFKIQSIRELSDYLKSSLTKQHQDEMTAFIENELKIPLN